MAHLVECITVIGMHLYMYMSPHSRTQPVLRSGFTAIEIKWLLLLLLLLLLEEILVGRKPLSIEEYAISSLACWSIYWLI